MPKLRRGILAAVACFLILIVVAGSLFQVTTQRALERAEAFQFRRMLVTRLAEGDGYRFFFATNRRPDGGQNASEPEFGNQHLPELTFGWFDTSIEPSLGIGMLIDPTDWFQNEEIQLRAVQTMARKAFITNLRQQVRKSPNASLLVNINGFRERFPSALRKTAFVAHVLDIDSPILVFDWPGDQGSTPQGYRRAQQVARSSGKELAQLITLIIEDVQPERLWLLANSMGGEVVVTAFSALMSDPGLADLETEIEDVVLTAPDVSHKEFGHRFADEINALTKNLTVYVSSNDRALLMSRVLNRGRRLGESTVNPSNPDQSAEALKAFELVDPQSQRVTLVDVTPVNRTRNFHNFSLETPEFFDDLYLRLINIQTPRSRRHYRVHSDGGRDYWVLTQGR